VSSEQRQNGVTREEDIIKAALPYSCMDLLALPPCDALDGDSVIFHVLYMPKSFGTGHRQRSPPLLAVVCWTVAAGETADARGEE